MHLPAGHRTLRVLCGAGAIALSAGLLAACGGGSSGGTPGGTMTALAEGEVLLGRLGAIVLARWWPGPGPVPVRDGWLPAAATQAG
jgi:hypothetical protein